MGLSHEQVGSTIPAKINTYNCSPEQNYLFISAMRHPVAPKYVLLSFCNGVRNSSIISPLLIPLECQNGVCTHHALTNYLIISIIIIYYDQIEHDLEYDWICQPLNYIRQSEKWTHTLNGLYLWDDIVYRRSISIRRLMGSTNQADPSCFYFRI